MYLFIWGGTGDGGVIMNIAICFMHLLAQCVTSLDGTYNPDGRKILIFCGSFARS